MQKVILSKKYGVDLVRFTHTNNAVICASKNGWDGMYSKEWQEREKISGKRKEKKKRANAKKWGGDRKREEGFIRRIPL
jgi:hypothetical protein